MRSRLGGHIPCLRASGLSPPGPSLSPPLRQWELARGEPTARVLLSAPEKDSGPGPMLSSAAEGRYHQHILATQPLMSAVEAEALETGQATVLRDSTRTLQAHRWILLSIGPADSSVGPAACHPDTLGLGPAALSLQVNCKKAGRAAESDLAAPERRCWWP